MIVDVDSHVYEPETIWTEYLEEKSAAGSFALRPEGVVLNGVLTGVIIIAILGLALRSVRLVIAV